MPKLKTHSGAKKRFKKTGTGKITRGQTKTRHILSSKSPKVKRKLGKIVLVSDGDYAKVARMIPYALTTAWGSPSDEGSATNADGQDKRPPPERNAS